MLPPPSQTPTAAADAAGVRPRSLDAWLVVVRPRSLLVALGPVVVGAAFGYARTGALDPAASLLVLAAAVLMQLVTNMQNDVGYTLRGAERSGTRTGLPRATSNGWLRVRDVRLAIVVASLLSAIVGALLVAYRGPVVLVIGIVSLLAALAYMAGPKPIAYTPLGEATVFVFFGLVAVTGTDWVLTGSIGTATMIASVAVGCLAAAALCVNNHRDIAHDRSVGRRTFAVTFGPRASRRMYAVLLATPFMLLPLVAVLAALPRAGHRYAAGALLPLALAPVARRLYSDFGRCEAGATFNAILFRTFRLELAFSVLLALGAILGRLLA